MRYLIIIALMLMSGCFFEPEEEPECYRWRIETHHGKEYVVQDPTCDNFEWEP